MNEIIYGIVLATRNELVVMGRTFFKILLFALKRVIIALGF